MRTFCLIYTTLMVCLWVLGFQVKAISGFRLRLALALRAEE